jgi:hypothetical protein
MLVAAAKILAAKSGTLFKPVHPALSAHLVGLPALFVLVAHNLVLFNWMFYKLVCLEQTTSIRCLCPHLTTADH